MMRFRRPAAFAASPLRPTRALALLLLPGLCAAAVPALSAQASPASSAARAGHATGATGAGGAAGALASPAKALAAPATTADGEKLRLRNELGIVQAKGGHLEDALRQFSLVLAEQPEQPAALNNAANVYFLQGQTPRARELYERAIAAAPREGGLHLNLGVLLHAVGEEEASLTHVRRGLRLVGDVQNAYFLLGLSTQDAPESGVGADAGTANGSTGVAGAAGAVSAAGVAGASGGPGAPGAIATKAADEAGLRTVEIEDLLARAMQKIPRADSLSTRSTVAEANKVATRAAGTKADQVETGPQRLYWMPLALAAAERP
jgi:tetratricopeptide (TPR) repeat protein